MNNIVFEKQEIKMWEKTEISNFWQSQRQGII